MRRSTILSKKQKCGATTFNMTALSRKALISTTCLNTDRQRLLFIVYRDIILKLLYERTLLERPYYIDRHYSDIVE
jgi:hypothetical protein